MIDAFVWLAPLLLLAVVGLLGFVGCDVVYGLHRPPELEGDVQFVQVAVDHVDLAPVNNVVAAFASPLTAGNLIVVWIWFHSSSGQSVASVTDAAGNGYLPADTLKSGAGTLATGRQQVWYAKDVVATSGPLTVTFTGSVEPGIGVGAFEYTNVTTEPLVSAAAGTGFGHDAQNADVTTTGARMLFGAVLFGGEGTNDPAAARRLIQRGNVAEDYLAVNLPQRITATATNPENQDWVAQLVAFK